VSARRAVLLVGSARPPGTGNSEALASYLLARLDEGGMESEVFHVHRCQRPERERALFEAADGADLFTLVVQSFVAVLDGIWIAGDGRPAGQRDGHEDRYYQDFGQDGHRSITLQIRFPPVILSHAGGPWVPVDLVIGFSFTRKEFFHKEYR